MGRRIEYVKKFTKKVTGNELLKENLKICGKTFITSYLIAFIYYTVLLIIAKATK